MTGHEATGSSGKTGVGYRAVTAASKPPVLPLSTQMRVAAEMAAPEVRGLAEMIGTEWQAEALRLEAEVESLRADAIYEAEQKDKWKRRATAMGPR